eukprot:6171530-Prymnesium_polylepis.2
MWVSWSTLPRAAWASLSAASELESALCARAVGSASTPSDDGSICFCQRPHRRWKARPKK